MARVLAAPDDSKRVTMGTLDELEEAIELLRVAYERYFNGVDRVPPTREHDDIKRRVRLMMTSRGGPTALRFRMQTLKARLVTYEQYWTRILLQIEKGTFKRILAESSRREQIERRRVLEAPQVPEPAPASVPDEDAPRPRAGTAPPRAPSQPSRAALPDGVDAGEVRELFKKFVAAKKAAGEPTEGLTYGKLVDKLARELPSLRAKHGGDIRFEVATEGGKVRLRARSRKDADQKAS